MKEVYIKVISILQIVSINHGILEGFNKIAPLALLYNVKDSAANYRIFQKFKISYYESLLGELEVVNWIAYIEFSLNLNILVNSSLPYLLN